VYNVSYSYYVLPTPTDDNFPGRPSNPVGFAAAPGFTSLTSSSGPFTSGSPGNPTIIMFKDFDAGTSSTNIDANWVTFIGCRFQSNATGGNCVSSGSTGCQNIVFSYCSFVPRVALVGNTPPGATWPSAGAGTGAIANTGWITGTNCIDGNNGYQFGFDCHNLTDGPITWDHCDFWGFANAVNFIGHTAQMIVRDCWIHDARNGTTLSDHTDGPGYLNGGVGPQNVWLDHNTIASIGSQNGIAWQGGTAAYSGMQITRNFCSGFNTTATLFQGVVGSNTNLSFTDNVFGTDLPWVNFPITEVFADWTSPNGVWRRNTFRVLPGTSPAAGNQWGISWTQADSGKFLLPNVNTTVTLSTTDYTG